MPVMGFPLGGFFGTTGTGLDWYVDGSAAPSVAGTKLASETADVYGVDKYFDGRPRTTGNGEENLRRALLRRLMTRPGTYRTKPGYGAGIQDFVKKSSNQATIEDLQNRVRGQVQQDRRVDKVLTCAVTKEFFSDQPGVRVVLVVQSKGRTLRPMTFDFKRTV
jgi:phage baseplate assembly protein W